MEKCAALPGFHGRKRLNLDENSKGMCGGHYLFKKQ